MFFPILICWLRWVSVAVPGLPQASHCRIPASHCGAFSFCRALLQDPQASVVVVHGLSCPAAFGVFPDQV